MTLAFIDRHISVLHALLAHGADEVEARRLVGEARAVGRADVRFTSTAGELVIRRVLGNHADVYLVLGPGS